MTESLNTIIEDSIELKDSKESRASIVNIHLQENNKSTNLVEILTHLFIDKDFVDVIDILTFSVSPIVSTIVKRILEKSPQSLNKITVDIKNILEDGVIDHKDIPKFIFLVTNIYKTEFTKLLTDISYTAKDTVEFIKFLIKIIIEFDLVIVNNKMNAFNMLDVSCNLLELVLPDNKIKLSFSCCFPKK